MEYQNNHRKDPAHYKHLRVASQRLLAAILAAREINTTKCNPVGA